jgi:RNA polymerase sigma-70 factor (ECF subfamily)
LRHAIYLTKQPQSRRNKLEQRIAFVLCEVEGYTSGEAAQIVDKSENTVRTRLFHAKRKLRTWLEQEGAR